MYGDFVPTSLWGRQAETANQYLSRGRKVYIEGHLRPDPQTGSPSIYQKRDGTVGASYEITADSVTFLDGRQRETAAYDAGTPATEVDEIPF